MQQLLDMSDSWYNKNKYSKDMDVQVLSKDLPHVEMDGDNYPLPINAERCIVDNIYRRNRIVSPNNTPRRFFRVLTSEKPSPLGTSTLNSSVPMAFTNIINRFRGPNSIDCFVSENISRAVSLNF